MARGALRACPRLLPGAPVGAPATAPPTPTARGALKRAALFPFSLFPSVFSDFVSRLRRGSSGSPVLASYTPVSGLGAPSPAAHRRCPPPRTVPRAPPRCGPLPRAPCQVRAHAPGSFHWCLTRGCAVACPLIGSRAATAHPLLGGCVWLLGEKGGISAVNGFPSPMGFLIVFSALPEIPQLERPAWGLSEGGSGKGAVLTFLFYSCGH